jgi:hypothetical protein
LGAEYVLAIFVSLAIIAWLAAADPESPFILRSVTAIAGVSSLVAGLPNLIGAGPLVMVDHFLWFLFFLAAAACWGGVHLVRMIPAGSLAPRIFARNRAPIYFDPGNLIVVFCAAALCYETVSIVRSRWNAEMSFYTSPAPNHLAASANQPQPSSPPEPRPTSTTFDHSVSGPANLVPGYFEEAVCSLRKKIRPNSHRPWINATVILWRWRRRSPLFHRWRSQRPSRHLANGLAKECQNCAPGSWALGQKEVMQSIGSTSGLK